MLQQRQNKIWWIFIFLILNYVYELIFWITNYELLTKGPNYKKPTSINFIKACFEIDKALKAIIEKMSIKNKLDMSTLTPWSKSVLIMVKKET